MPVYDETAKISTLELSRLLNRLDKRKLPPGISTPRSKDSIFKPDSTVQKDGPSPKEPIAIVE